MPALYLDDLQTSKIQPASLLAYRRQVALYLQWLKLHQFSPQGASEHDDLLVEFRRASQPSRSGFINLVAGIEFIFPHYRGKLVWSKSILAGWAVAAPVVHTTPLPWAGAILLAESLAKLSFPRLSLALLLQQRAGLRPSEVLGLSASDVQISGRDPALCKPHQILLCLGTKKGTKVKRRQFALLEDAGLHNLVSIRLARLQPDDKFINHSYSQYRYRLKQAQASRRWKGDFTPHSPRAGFVSDLILAGWSPSDIRFAGRWASEKSFKTYLDVITAATLSGTYAADFRLAPEVARAIPSLLGDLNDDAAIRKESCPDPAQECYSDSNESEGGVVEFNFSSESRRAKGQEKGSRS
jgi:integrase